MITFSLSNHVLIAFIPTVDLVSSAATMQLQSFIGADSRAKILPSSHLQLGDIFLSVYFIALHSIPINSTQVTGR